MEAAKCYDCIPPNMQDAVKTYLLYLISGSSLSISQLVAAAAEFQRIPGDMQLAVQNTLLCDILASA
jgi:hypothetical protein